MSIDKELQQEIDPVSDEDILSQAKKRFKDVEDAENHTRKEALEDLKFVVGDQWPDDVKTQRNLDGRPCLTINRLPQFVRQITNDQRQNRPSIKVYPVDSKADVDTANVIQGMIKHIEYNSNADLAYDTAFEAAVRMGRGFFRILTDYSSPESFDQEIIIRMIENAFTVYFDPFSIEPDGSDATYALVVEDVSKATFKTMYPDAKLSSMDDWSSLGSNSQGWISNDTARVAEYFVKDYKRKKIALLSNGDVIDMPDEDANLGVDEAGKPIVIKDTRYAEVPVIKWYKFSGNEILEKKDWPGYWIPIVPVYGDKLNVDGKKIFEGIIRHAKDPQRMYNYWSSNETEVIALAPRAPFVGVAGQFEGYEEKWRDANKRNFPYLEYNPVDINGSPAAPPTRNVYEPPVQAITQAKAFSADDLKATTGIYDSALGSLGVEQSGIAIQRRNTQSQTSNYHFIDNMTRALRHTGRIIVDLLPAIYDTARAVRILKDDGTSEMTAINQIFTDKKGQSKRYDLSIGKYDVVVETGPSYATKRIEAAHSIEKVIQSYPQLMQIAGDLLISNMDWPGAKELGDRLKKTIPPDLLEDDNQPQIPPQAQAQMQQMQSMIVSLTKSLNDANQHIANKKLELASKERIEMAKLQVQAETTLLKEGVSNAQFELEQEIAMLDRREKILQAQQPLTPDFNQQAAGHMAAPQVENVQQPIGGFSPS